jgi:hypothetical protein
MQQVPRHAHAASTQHSVARGLLPQQAGLQRKNMPDRWSWHAFQQRTRRSVLHTQPQAFDSCGCCPALPSCTPPPRKCAC